MGLRLLACWDCIFESRRGHGCLSLVSVVGCVGRGLCNGQIPRTEKAYQVCVYVCVCVCVIGCNQVQTLFTYNERAERGQNKKQNVIIQRPS